MSLSLSNVIEIGLDLSLLGERLRGNTVRGNRTESLREENLPPRRSLRGPPKTSERYTGNEDQVTKGISEVLSETLSRKIFLSETLGPVAPNCVAP